MTPDKIWTEVRKAAEQAAIAQNDKLGLEASRGLDCGFAWITISPARGAFVAFLKSIGIGRVGSHSGGPGYGIWYSQLHDIPTQSVSVHEAAAAAAVKVLLSRGISASCSSRLD